MTDQPQAEPELTSVFPMGARVGSAVEVEIRGKNLQGTYSVWSSSKGFKAKVEKVEEIVDELPKDEKEEEKPKEIEYRVLLRLEIDPTTQVGNHSFRLVSPLGISNPLRFESMMIGRSWKPRVLITLQRRPSW